MQIVIDIEDSKYIHIKTFEEIYRDMSGRFELELAVLNGIVLPKNHGRLIDATDLLEICEFHETEMEVSAAPTVIPGAWERKMESEEV